MSLLISGAIIGQDTEHGNRSKEQASQTVLYDLVKSDLEMAETMWNNIIIPSLVRIGWLPSGLTFEFNSEEDIEQLFEFTAGLLPYKEIDNEWIKDKFGVEVTDKKPPTPRRGEKERPRCKEEGGAITFRILKSVKTFFRLSPGYKSGAGIFYIGLHSKLASIYEHVELIDKKKFAKISAAFSRAAKFLHSNKRFTPDDLKHTDVKPLIDETFNILKGAIDTGIKTEIPEAMLQKLQQDVFLFSGMKTYTQLKEASLLLRDETGNIKSEAKFFNDVKKIDATYNENYLRAERQYAISASQSAAQYHDYMQDADRYNLQIRTAADDKVRASHAALHNVTRPADDVYWNNTWTPFDWGCRCRIIQVLKDKYPVTDIDKANEAEKKAVPALFRFNPGREQIIFPKKHPYYPQHCSGEKLDVSGLIGYAKWLLEAEGDRCRAKKEIERMNKQSTKKKRDEYIRLMEPLLKRNVIKDVEAGEKIKVTFNTKGAKHIADDMLNKNISLRKSDLNNLHKLIDKSKYSRTSELYKKRKDDIQRFYYFKDKQKEIYYHVAEAVEKRAKGRLNVRRFLYSMSKEIPEK